MLESLDDKNDPGRPKALTNADEQDVAVNHSTTDHGYDEPAATQPPVATSEPEKKEKPYENEKTASEEPNVKKKAGKGPSSQTDKIY
jgi:hypothetical protein